ncbi:MAG: beta-ketoacyl-ACP reductase [Candidatus Dadabacteria bacterium RIFCSPHIGHO2_12_FULL_53_21]|nr:MAG: beta-ketoacyl-ACP reductase [Candidatus Dadabacteria bacterium RIFCSPHIGHO2_12_FULL_53_21]
MHDLSGKVAIVTGGSRGIGRAICLALAEAGADILLNYSRSDKEADKVKKEVEKFGRKCVTVRANVGNFQQAQGLGKAVMSHFGKVDILVNNAGINRDRTLKRMTFEQWNEVIQTNLSSVFNCTKAVIDPLSERGGVIISISSIIGEMGNLGQCNYASTKAGIIGFTKTMARELAKSNIRVNAIAPGFVETDMLGTVPEDIRDQIKKEIALGRFGTPEEIAMSVVYLCSTAASWITGVTLRINGGHYI